MIEIFKSRITIALVVSYILGIFLCFNLDLMPLIYVGCTLLTVLLVLLIVKKNKSVFIGLLACVLMFMLGALLMNYSDNNRSRTFRNYIGEKCWVYGTVTTEPKITAKGNHYGVTVDVYKIEQNGKSRPVNGKMIVYVKRYYDTAPKINDNIYFFTQITKPDYKEGNFDYELYLKTKDIYATGITHATYLNSVSSNDMTFADKFMIMSRKINVFFQKRIEATCGYDESACALIKGILLGDKIDFSDEMTQDISLAGFSHIVAASGLHLNILFGAFCGLLGFLKVRRKLIAFLALPVILLFAAITGFSPSVCRAAIMLSIYTTALLFKRQYDSLTALFVSAFIILTYNPYTLFSISFMLSFASTLSIILIYPKINLIFLPIEKKSKILKSILSTVAMSIATFIGTAPFVLYYFNTVTFSSIISNIWIIPMCGPIFILGYGISLLSLILPQILCNFMLYPLAALIKIILKTAEIFADFDFLAISCNNLSPYLILIYFALICFFQISAKKIYKKLKQMRSSKSKTPSNES